MAREVLDRRRLLQIAGVGAIVAVAGCTRDDDEGFAGEDQHDTIRVGPGGEYEFSPDEIQVPTGTTVEFIWESSGHNIIVESQPDRGDWNGIAEQEDEGFEHEHTFETEGTFEYVCNPHEDDGMTATIEVEDQDDGTDDTGGTPGY